MNGSYNFFADSFNLSPIQLSARSNLFDKINITASAVLDPYDVDGQGQRVDQILWLRKPFSFGRITSGNVAVSTQLRGGDKKKGESTTELQPGESPSDIGLTDDQYDSELAYIRNNPGEYADFNIPWSVNFSYSLSFSKVFQRNVGFKNQSSQNTTIGGTLNLTPKWQMAINGYYNITLGQLNGVSVSISRDMHCWQMSISLQPVGQYRSFSINISPKSPLLRDIRVNRTRSFRE
jgi:hypothetical protein